MPGLLVSQQGHAVITFTKQYQRSCKVKILCVETDILFHT